MKLFTKTWRRDLIWLKWAFRSVYKYCDEPVIWHVITENDTTGTVQNIADECARDSNSSFPHKIIVHGLDLWPETKLIHDTYMSQQWIKMTADRVVGNDLVWNWDSDVFAQKHFSEADFLGANKLPIYWFSELDRFKGSNDYSVLRQRADLLETIFGSKVSREWMRCMPIPLIGSILKEGYRSDIWNKCYKECAAGNRGFSEFNAIGQFNYLYFNGSFDWRNADDTGPTWGGNKGDNSIVFQNWSWGGETAEIRSWIQKEFGTK